MRLPALLVLLVAGGTSLQSAERVLIVEPDALKQEIARVRLVDLRPVEDYRKAHLPGAVNCPLRQLDDLEANRQGLPVPLDQARAVFSALGLDADTPVVGYDDAGNRFAARLFYFLEFFGHRNVRVLDGGFQNWAKNGGALETGEVKVPPGHAVPRPMSSYIATAEWISDRLGKGELTLVDARSEDEFTGKQKASGRAGHIPGAVSFDWRETLTPDGRFKSPEELRTLLQKKGVSPDREAVAYCQSGVRASQLYFVLRLLGYKVRNYDGSYEDWESDARRPVEK